MNATSVQGLPTRCFLQAQRKNKTSGTIGEGYIYVSREEEGYETGVGLVEEKPHRGPFCVLGRKGTWLPREGNNQNRLGCLKSV